MTGDLTAEALDRASFEEHFVESISELLCLVWPKPGRTVETRVDAMLHEMDVADERMQPRSFVIAEEGELIAHAQLLPRTVGTTLGDMTIAGLARVCTHPEQRGRGLGEIIVRAAFELIDRGEFEWSLFQTSPNVRPFYEKLNSVTIDNRIVNSLNDDPQANPFWDTEIMRYPAGGDWPEGTIDLRGQGY